MIALTNKTFDYVTEDEKKLVKAEQTVFILKNLSARQQAMLQDEMEFDVKNPENIKLTKLGSRTLTILSFGLVGWKNLKSSDGKEVEFSKNMEENFDVLPEQVRYELANVIMTTAPGLNDKTLKN